MHRLHLIAVISGYFEYMCLTFVVLLYLCYAFDYFAFTGFYIRLITAIRGVFRCRFVLFGAVFVFWVLWQILS